MEIEELLRNMFRARGAVRGVVSAGAIRFFSSMRLTGHSGAYVFLTRSNISSLKCLGISAET